MVMYEVFESCVTPFFFLFTWHVFSARRRVATASSDVRSCAGRETGGPRRRAAAPRAPGRPPAAAAGSPTALPGTGGEKETGRR